MALWECMDRRKVDVCMAENPSQNRSKVWAYLFGLISSFLVSWGLLKMKTFILGWFKVSWNYSLAGEQNSVLPNVMPINKPGSNLAD